MVAEWNAEDHTQKCVVNGPAGAAAKALSGPSSAPITVACTEHRTRTIRYPPHPPSYYLPYTEMVEYEVVNKRTMADDGWTDITYVTNPL